MHLLSFTKTKKAVLAGSLLFFFGLTSGCMQRGGVLSSTSEAPASGNSVAIQVQNYGDIELPVEMELVPDETMALDTDSFQGGVHHYKGRVDIDSLREYVVTSMRNHKWKLMGEARYNYVMLAFTKPNRTCLAVLKPGMLGNTVATFYVTVDVAAANRLNPFGEPLKQQ